MVPHYTEDRIQSIYYGLWIVFELAFPPSLSIPLTFWAPRSLTFFLFLEIIKHFLTSEPLPMLAHLWEMLFYTTSPLHHYPSFWTQLKYLKNLHGSILWSPPHLQPPRNSIPWAVICITYIFFLALSQCAIRIAFCEYLFNVFKQIL